jgi:hypothetical protein
MSRQEIQMNKPIDDTTNKGADRIWHEIDGEKFSLTSDGTVLDSDGKPLAEGHPLTERIRHEIGTKRPTNVAPTT